MPSWLNMAMAANLAGIGRRGRKAIVPRVVRAVTIVVLAGVVKVVAVKVGDLKAGMKAARVAAVGPSKDSLKSNWRS